MTAGDTVKVAGRLRWPVTLSETRYPPGEEKGEMMASLRQAGGQQDICVTKVTDFVYVIYP
jgi:hypothetical protein